jgi:endonuclease III
MKNATECAKKLAALMKKLPEAETPGFPDQDDPVAVLIQSFMMWEATTEKALSAYASIKDHIVDYNDLRVSLPHEMAGWIGARYPRAEERCQRLRAVLRNIYLREHEASMKSLAAAGKRDIKRYVESLEGVVPYVANRVLLLCFDTHAVPVDEQLRAQLIAAGAVDDSADCAEIAGWLSRQIKAADGQAAHVALQAWIDAGGDKTARTTRKKTTANKTTTKKKTTKKKTAGSARSKTSKS